jgi:hypothetical protein
MLTQLPSRLTGLNVIATASLPESREWVNSSVLIMWRDTASYSMKRSTQGKCQISADASGIGNIGYIAPKRGSSSRLAIEAQIEGLGNYGNRWREAHETAVTQA